MRGAIAIIATVAALAAAAVLAQVGPAVTIAQGIAASPAGAGMVQWVQSCGTVAAALAPADDGRVFLSVKCWVDGTTPVFFGSAAVTTAIGFPVCEDAACIEAGRGTWEANVRRGGTGCIVSSGSVSVRCQGPAPQ